MPVRMTFGRTRAILLVLGAIAAGATIAEAQRLNPTVKVLPSPAAPVPSECADGAAPQPVPRIEREALSTIEIPQEAPAAPPRADLRTQLLAVRDAAASGYRDTFVESLAAVKRTLATYPAGGEKSSANDVVAVYDDVAALWDHQFSSTHGAFFDETSGLYSTLRRYPGWSAAVADSVLTDANGVKFYPTRESREFLAGEAARRLATAGFRGEASPRDAGLETTVPARTVPAATSGRTEPTTTPRSAVSEPSSSPTPRSVAAQAPAPHTSTVSTQTPARTRITPRRRRLKQTTDRPSTKAAASTKANSTTAKAAATKASGATASSGVAKAAPKPAEAAHAAATPAADKPAPVTYTAAVPAPSSAAPAAAVQEPSAGAPVVQPDGSLSGPAAAAPTATSDVTTSAVNAPPADPSDTTATVASQPATTPAPAAAEQAKRRNILVPLILIVVGVGVLFVLFRTSN